VKAGFKKPTPVQAAAIPLALMGRDIVARARTGSGKTAAYAIPIIQQILHAKDPSTASASTAAAAASTSSSASSSSSAASAPGVRALILVPTAELCRQVKDVFIKLVKYCSSIISVGFLTRDIPADIRRKRLAELPDILVATPNLLLGHLTQKHLRVRESLLSFVMDEADLLISYSCADDLREIAADHLPAKTQAYLMSATLSDQVNQLKQLVLHSPAVLRLREAESKLDNLKQYSITYDRRPLLLYDDMR